MLCYSEKMELQTVGKDGKSRMCKKLDKLIKEERLEERKETAEAKNREFARSLQADGMDDKRIARYTKASVEQVEIWLK